MKTYEEVKALYLQWLQNPVGTQGTFFRVHKWTRDRFFEEAQKRQDDV